MLVSEQSELVKTLLAMAGISGAAQVEMRAGWLIVDDVPHRLYAEALGAPDAPPLKKAKSLELPATGRRPPAKKTSKSPSKQPPK